MSAGFESQSPETAGLAAAKSGFGLVEGAFLPIPRLIGPASLWLLAVFSFGAVAVAAGITIGEDVSLLGLDSGVSPIAVGEPPIAAEGTISRSRVIDSSGSLDWHEFAGADRGVAGAAAVENRPAPLVVESH